MRRREAIRRVIRLPIQDRACHGVASALPRLAELGRAYVAARECLHVGRPPPEWFFQLPGEPRPLTRHMSSWVRMELDSLGISAPPGFAYQGHSLRSGGSSAAEAIGVSRFRGNWLGGWSQSGSTRERHYIDPSITPSPGAYALLGWLLDGDYSSGPTERVRVPATRARADPGEP